MSATISAIPGRRVVTEPVPHIRQRTTHTTDKASATDLFKYDDPNIKFFSFTVLRGSDRPGTATGQHEVGTIPWRSRSERLVTVGHLRLYRAPSEALMIDSGDKNWRLPMMPGSKCWCVNNEATFAMKLLDTVYRIELPFDSSEEKIQVDQFKKILSSTIRYERDPCPFKRDLDSEEPLEDAGSPVARRQLIGTLHKHTKPYNLDGRRYPRRPSSAQTDGSLDISDDDNEAMASPVYVLESQPSDIPETRQTNLHNTRQADLPFALVNGVFNGNQESVLHRENDDKRSFTAPLLSHVETTPHVPSTDIESHAADFVTSLGWPALIIPAEPDEGDELQDTSLLKQDGPTVPTPEPQLAEIALDVVDTPESTTVLVPADERPSGRPLDSSHLSQPESETGSQLRSSSSSADLATGLQSADPSDAAFPSLTTTEVVESTSNPPTVLDLPVDVPSNRPITPPPARRVSVSSVDALRMPGTPPTQPPTKSASTTRTSTVTSSFRHSSISSDDDVPSLGLLSQTLNVLLGPPSGLMSVLMGFARRVGSYSRGTGGRSLGLGSTNGEWEGTSPSQRRAGMPGSWDSEDERDSPGSSGTDHVKNARETNGLKKTQSWASASETAIGNNGAAKSSAQRPEITREWTDDDLD